MIIYIVDNYLKIVYKNKVINYKFISINKGRIINKEKFIEEFMILSKKEKFKAKLFGDNIEIIRNSFYLVSDLAFLESIFLELGFNKVSFRDIREFYQESNTTYIEFNDTYLVLNLEEGLFLDLEYYKDIPLILDYFKDRCQKQLIFYGSNKKIPHIQLKNKDVYYFDDYQTYIIDMLLKMKKE